MAELDFVKYVKGRKERGVKLSANTFVAEFDVDEFENSGELSEYLKNEIKETFQKLNLNGKYFFAVGKEWAWSVGSMQVYWFAEWVFRVDLLDITWPK